MAWIEHFERKDGGGRRQPTEVIGFVKVFETLDASPVVQIDTQGSSDRKIHGKQSQTLQLGREAAQQLFDILKETYNFR